MYVKHIMWFHAKKSQPKHSKKQNSWIYNIIRAVQLRITQNNLKVGSRICNLLIFFSNTCMLFIGWYQVTRWIIMFRGFRICTKKLGRESRRPSNGRLKLTLISKFTFCSLAENYAATIFEISLSHWINDHHPPSVHLSNYFSISQNLRN